MSVTLPKTKTYRVATLAVHYRKPVEDYNPDGQPVVSFITGIGRFGEEIELTDGEAKRLDSLGPLVDPNRPDGERRPAVKPVDEPLTYDEMDEKQLKALVKERGVEVAGSGANETVLKTDLLNALHNYDQGHGTAASVV